ncbi:MAG: hypothetical protein U9Q70_05680 [Chloroflexota bacterium]|nr:hypothetical protein [Chloroflexota bacterium]
MELGLLWYDEGAACATQLPGAVQRYRERERLRGAPNVCYVPPRVQVAESPLGGLTIRPAPVIPSQHFWLGLDKTPERNEP